MKPIQVPAPKLEDVISENEYTLVWYYCQLKVDDELEDYQCDHNEEGPNCTTCPYQIKTNEEIQRVADECREWNRNHGFVKGIVKSSTPLPSPNQTAEKE